MIGYVILFVSQACLPHTSLLVATIILNLTFNLAYKVVTFYQHICPPLQLQCSLHTLLQLYGEVPKYCNSSRSRVDEKP